MVVVDQVLIRGVGMHRFHVARIDAELVVHRLQHRHDGIGGAGRCSDNRVARLDGAGVDPGNDVLDGALPRCGEQDTLDDVYGLHGEEPTEKSFSMVELEQIMFNCSE